MNLPLKRQAIFREYHTTRADTRCIDEIEQEATSPMRVERLEDRRLLAVDVEVLNGDLVVSGTATGAVGDHRANRW